MLSGNPLLSTETVYYTPDLGGAGHQEKEDKEKAEEYLLSLICECPGVNCSVVGLLVFANPTALALKSVRTKLSALQSALLHGAPLDVVQLLFELEGDQQGFAQTLIPASPEKHYGVGVDANGDNDPPLLPVQLLLRGVMEGKGPTPAYRLRTSPLRHALFMGIVEAWEASLEKLDRVDQVLRLLEADGRDRARRRGRRGDKE